MNLDKLRIMVAEKMGWNGCTDVRCEFRKAQHLHKDGKAWFFESYTIPSVRVPNFPLSLDACIPAITDKMKEEGWHLILAECMKNEWHAQFIRSGHEPVEAIHSNPATALCLAFLAAHGKDIQQLTT